MSSNEQQIWLRSKWALFVGFIASAITLFSFLTGIFSLPSVIGRSEALQPTHASLSSGIESASGPMNTAPTSDSPKRTDPVEFIHQYYALVQSGNYEEAFALLTEDFRDRNHTSDLGGYGAYVDWWESIERIEILSARVEYSQGNIAKVVATIHYSPESSPSYEDEVYFQLLYDPSRETWLIDATPFR